MKVLMSTLLVLAVIPAAMAQEQPAPPRILPGSLWVATESSPAEGNNIVTQLHAEQGYTLWRRGNHFLTSFVSADLVADTERKDWNNKAAGAVGVKYSRIFRNGLVELKGGFAAEKRLRTGNSSAQPTASASYWFGWNQPQRGDRPTRFLTGLPGNSWGVVGNVSPAEKRNVIGMFSITQGVTAIDHGNWQMIPFVKLQPGFDTKGYDWNNKVKSGAGVKLALLRKSSTVDVGLQYLDERRKSARSGGVSFFVTLWSGWSPSLSNK
jgi:hypothetical protein